MDQKTGAQQTGQAKSWWEQNPEIVVVATRKVSCEGVGGSLGHPRVWYDMGEEDHVECKYCDRVFVLKGGSKDTPKPA